MIQQPFEGKIALFKPAGIVLAACFALAAFLPSIAGATGYPPYWDNSTGALHYKPLSWPSEMDWMYYSHSSTLILDQRVADPSNGGRAPQNYVNVSSSCNDQSQPSVAWLFSSDELSADPEPTMFFRFKVEQIPNTYATGPLTQSAASVDPFFAAQWTVLIDYDGDGYREFAVNLYGASGTPSAPVDVLRSIYSDTPGQSIEFYDSATGKGDPNIHLLADNPTAFMYNSYGAGDPYLAYQDYILNFQNSYAPTPVWPNGTSERIWDYGSTRVQDISTPTCIEYIVDFQIPMAMLDATSVGGPRVTENTPMCLAFVTANSNVNPLQKDFAFDGTGSLTVDDCVPCGDMISASGGVVSQPQVSQVTATGCDTTVLSANVRDAIGLDCTDSVASVEFHYYWDKDADGNDDDGQAWTLIGSGTVDAANPGVFTLSGWDTTTLNAGQYLIGVKATDDDGNVTYSHLTSAEVPGGSFANPDPEPGVQSAAFNNYCGESWTMAKSVSPDYQGAGGNVTVTLSVTNDTSTAHNLNALTDHLPAGFSYQSSPAEGGTLNASIATQPSNDATGDVTWTFSGASVAAGATATLTFTMKVSTVTGTYTNTASAVTADPDWTDLEADPVDVGVGEPRLTIAKRPSVFSVMPGDSVTYTLTYSNDSPVNATDVTVVDDLPTGVTFVGATGGGVYDSDARTITWDLGDLASLDGPYTLTYEVTVDKEANSRTENTVTIDSPQTDPATATAAVFVQSPLKIEKTAGSLLVTPGAASPNDRVTFTIAYQNTGTTALTNVVVSDTTPPGFSYLSNTGSGTPAEPSGDGYGDDDGICETGEPCTVTWPTIASLAASGSGSYTVTIQVTNPYGGTANPAVNIAQAASDQTATVTDTSEVAIRDADCSGNPTEYYFKDLDASDIAAPVGLPVADRRYTSTTVPTATTATAVTAAITDNTAWEMGYFILNPPFDRTTGFAIAGTVDLSVYVDKDAGGPVNLTVYLYDYNPDTGAVTQIGIQQADTGNGAKSNTELTMSIVPSGLLSPGDALLWRLVAQRQNTSFSGNFSIRFDGTASPSYGAVCFAPLSVTMQKSVVPTLVNPPPPAQSLTYTMTFANSGQRDVTGATIVDTLPTGLTFTSATLNGAAATPVGGTCPSNVCTFNIRTSDTATVGQVTAGQSGTLTITAAMANPWSPTYDSVTSLVNTAVLEAPNVTDVTDTAVTDINLQLPDVVLYKSADATILYPGDEVTYTITAVNVGQATATGVAVSDTIPSAGYFAYVTGSIAGGTSRSEAGAPDLTWTVGDLAPGASYDLTFRMRFTDPPTGFAGGVESTSNWATATATNDTIPNSNTVKVSLTTNANISLTKGVSSPTASTGNVGTGNGSTTVFNATLADTPIQAESLSILVDGGAVGADDGAGAIIGSGLSASTINYDTGAVHVEFLTAPGSGQAVTASYRTELEPGSTVQYTLTVGSIGAISATGVTVSDPIPAGTTYVIGSLTYGGAPQTDANDSDHACYDPLTDRVVFTPGDMAAGTSNTLRFSVVTDDSFPLGTTKVTNTGTALATNTASKSASADIDVEAAPDLELSKSAPGTVAYPMATLSGNHSGVTTLTLNNPPGSQYFDPGDRIYVSGTPGYLVTVLTVPSDTTVTVDAPVTANNGTSVLEPIKYTINYLNTGSAEATLVRIKDVLPTGINYLSATPTPTTAPAYDTNGIVTWELGTVAPGETGALIVWTRPTAAGTTYNSAVVNSLELPDINSNITRTDAGGLEVRKSTSTAAIVNDPGNGTPEVGSYTITLDPQPVVTIAGMTVTDRLPTGFTFRAGTTAYTNGTCASVPAGGATTAVWSGCTSTAAGTAMTIAFSVDITATFSAGTYQNGVEVATGNLAVIPFDELITTAEDITVTIPGDVKVTKAISSIPSPCNAGSCSVTYLVTAANVGTANATGVVLTDLLPATLTYSPPYSASQGTYDPVTGAWNVGAIASGGYATLSITAAVTTFSSTITNCALLTSMTPTDTNSANSQGCVNISPTRVIVSRFDAHEEAGRVVVEWQTSSETETAGFYLYRYDGIQYRQLNAGLLPAMLDAPQGGAYRYVDATARPGNRLTYYLAEVESSGAVNLHGPYSPDVTASRKASRPAAGESAGAGETYTRTRHGLSGERLARRERVDASRRGRMPAFRPRSGKVLKVPVDRDGLYRVAAADLASLLGQNIGAVRTMIAQGNFQVRSQANEVAYLAAEENDAIVFYGQRLDDIYTDTNIYTVQLGRGVRMTRRSNGQPPAGPVSTFGEVLHVERDRVPLTSPMMHADEDYWFWGYLVAAYSGYDRMSMEFDVPDPAGSGTAVLTVRLQGFTETGKHPDHHLALYLNGTLVGEDRWDGLERRETVVSFDPALLRAGGNTLEARAVLDGGVPYSVFYLDSFDLSYVRYALAVGGSLSAGSTPGEAPFTAGGFATPPRYLLDLTDPRRPVAQSFTTSVLADGTWRAAFNPPADGAPYLMAEAGALIGAEPMVDTPSRLSGSGNQADYLVIAPPGLMDAAGAFAVYRRGRGLRSMAVSLEDVYDEFSYGIATPHALAAFLAASRSWAVPPRYVLLLGDGTFDYKDNLGYGENLVPILVAETPMGLYPSDGLYADVDGDHLPDLAVGRLPVQTNDEATSLLAKIAASEGRSSRVAVLLSDDPDEGGDFPANNRALAGLVPPGVEVRDISLADLGLAAAREELFGAWNGGLLLVNYFGHGSQDMLAREGLLSAADVPLTWSAGRLPVVNTFTCLAGEFSFPGYDTVSENLLLGQDAGAVAVWSPSGLSYDMFTTLLADGFFNGLSDESLLLGDVVRQAARAYPLDRAPSFMLDIYNLLGDPATSLW